MTNILFIVADDLNSWIAPLGRQPDVRTPAIDRLAQRGTLFGRAYCAAPYCNASRMSVFTGCLPGTTGIYQNEPFWDAPQRRTTFVETLRQRGYYCFGAGKVFHGTFDYETAGRERRPCAEWVERENRAALWHEFIGNIAEPMPPQRPLNRMFDFDRFDQVSPWNHLFDWGALPDDRETDMPDHQVARAVTRFLADPPQQPFFCAAGFYKPHLPWYVPQRFLDLYPRERVSLPFVKNDDLDDVPDIARIWALTPPDHATVLQHGQWRHAVQAYLAAISYVDGMIGSVIDALDRSPAAADTVVVLWGDNGFHLGEKLHWRKFALWEEATRVPLIVVPAGSNRRVARVDDPVSLVDLAPTLFEMCGLAPPPPGDGLSLAPAMNGHRSERRIPVVSTWLAGNHSIRQGPWRYSRYTDGGEELYDHLHDPYEWNNLIGDRRFAATADSLRRMVDRLPGAGK